MTLFLNGNLQAQATAASTPSYTGIPAPDPTDAGTKQCGSWANAGGWGDVLEAVPAQLKVSVSGSGVVQVGAPNQFRCQASLTNGTVQLTGHVNTATNVNTDPPVGTFVWVSRNSKVATVNQSGLVTLVGRGQVEIQCRYSRAANLPYAGAAPSPTESTSVYALCDLTVTA